MRGLVLAMVLGLAAGALAQKPGPREGVVQFVPRQVLLEVDLSQGERLVASTCDERVGDTMLTVRGPRGRRVAHNDDACGLGSRVTYTAQGEGIHRVVGTCYGGGSRCGGSLRWRIDPPGTETRRLPPGTETRRRPPWRLLASARGLVAPDGRNAGALLEVSFEARADSFWVGVGGPGLGLAGGGRGGIAVGSAYAFAGFDVYGVALGAGGGVATLATRPGDNPRRRALAAVLLAGRFGPPTGFHIDLRMAVAGIEEEVQPVHIGVAARLPLGHLELGLRGAGGIDGIVFGEAFATFWTDPRQRLGLSVHAGGSGAYYRQVCRFDTPCAEVAWAAGPSLGVGLQWRGG